MATGIPCGSHTIASLAGGGVRRQPGGEKLYIYIYSLLVLTLHFLLDFFVTALKGVNSSQLEKCSFWKDYQPASVFKECFLLHSPPANALLLKSEQRDKLASNRKREEWRRNCSFLPWIYTFTGMKLAWQRWGREHMLLWIITSCFIHHLPIP